MVKSKGEVDFFYEHRVNNSKIKDIFINLKDIKDIKGHFCLNKGHKGHFFEIKDIKDIVATLNYHMSINFHFKFNL